MPFSVGTAAIKAATNYTRSIRGERAVADAQEEAFNATNDIFGQNLNDIQNGLNRPGGIGVPGG